MNELHRYLLKEFWIKSGLLNKMFENLKRIILCTSVGDVTISWHKNKIQVTTIKWGTITCSDFLEHRCLNEERSSVIRMHS